MPVHQGWGRGGGAGREMKERNFKDKKSGNDKNTSYIYFTFPN